MISVDERRGHAAIIHSVSIDPNDFTHHAAAFERAWTYKTRAGEVNNVHIT